MATLEEGLIYPLILLLIGAGISGGLVTWLTNRWQNNRKELEIKVDIVSKMAEAMALQDANAFIYYLRKKKTLTDTEIDAYFADVKRWHTDTRIVGSKLQAYFPEEDIRKRWEKYCDLLAGYSSASRQYFYEYKEREEKLKVNLESIRDFFSGDTRVDWNQLISKLNFDKNEWNKVAVLVSERGDELVKQVLKLPIKVF
jgi:hypothetical protein